MSERLGSYTYGGRSRSRPRGLGAGRRSVTESDQRRALMLPQELMQRSSGALIILKAGTPPVRGRKIVYHRERAFVRRLRPPPVIPPAPAPPARPPADAPFSHPELAESDMGFDDIVRAFAAEGLPPPERGASQGEVRDWLDRVLVAETPASLEPDA